MSLQYQKCEIIRGAIATSWHVTLFSGPGTRCCRAASPLRHTAGMPVRQPLDRFGELYPVDAVIMKLRCTACGQEGQVTTRLARLRDSGCRHWRG